MALSAWQLVAHAGENCRLRSLASAAAGFVLDFVEQPHVLDRNRRLSAKW